MESIVENRYGMGSSPDFVPSSLDNTIFHGLAIPFPIGPYNYKVYPLPFEIFPS